MKDADCLVLAVAHEKFKKMSWKYYDSLFGKFNNCEKIIIDTLRVYLTVVKSKN